MKYEKPMIEVILFNSENVVRTSLIKDEGGSGGEYDGDWNN